MKRLLDGVSVNREMKDSAPDSACPIPGWQRAPTRVTFEPPGTPKQIFAIRGRSVDLLSEEQDNEEAEK
jgi:hypothetical protein